MSETNRHLESFEPVLGRSVSLQHAAQILRVSRRTIYNRIRDGRLQTIRTLGGSQRVLVESLNGFRPEDFSNGSNGSNGSDGSNGSHDLDAAPASNARTQITG